MRSTRPATSARVSRTLSCRSLARAAPTGATPGFRSSARSSAARSPRFWRSRSRVCNQLRQGGTTVKKLINSPETVVKDALAGMALAHPDLIKVHYDPDYVVRTDAPVKGKVGVISGGGSGHEPMHGGFVGFGMLDAACPGAVFTSPVPDQMLAATKAVNGGAGVLHVVKNYTGDVLNFEMAAELAQADG